MAGRVLIIDDSFVILAYVEEVLTKGGHEVVAAEDWSSARSAFRSNDPFHVILVDVNLPGMRSGDHLAKSLRMHPKAKDSKIVFFSAESDDHLQKLTNMSGMDGYITKGQGDDKFLKDVEAFMPPEVFGAGTQTTPANPFKTADRPKATPAKAPAAKKSWWKK